MGKSLLLFISSTAIFFASGIYNGLGPAPKIKEVFVEVPEKPKSFDAYLRSSARAYGVPYSLAQAMVRQESGGKMNAIRYEPGQVERAKKITGATGEQLRMYASSHCSLQIMAWHTPKYSLTWSDLYNPEVCAEMGMKIMADCLNRHKGAKSAAHRAFKALACYNGSEEYAQKIMNKLGEDLLDQYFTRAMS